MGKESKLNPFAQEHQPSSLLPIVRDAFGRALEQDDEILLNINDLVRFRVASVVPELNPSLPPNLLQVHVGCMLTFTVKREASVREMIRIRTAAEAGASNFKMLGAIHQDPGSES